MPTLLVVQGTRHCLARGMQPLPQGFDLSGLQYLVVVAALDVKAASVIKMKAIVVLIVVFLIGFCSSLKQYNCCLVVIEILTMLRINCKGIMT